MRPNGPKTHRLDWDDLRTALHLARGGSVRKAARALGVSHSTILRRVATLESASGVRLFERTARGLDLTAAGQDVFDTARDVEELVTGLERRVAGRDLRPSGPVRITLPDPMLPLLLPDLRVIADAYPAIGLTLAVTTGYVDLAHREADVALRVAAEPPPDLVGRRLVTAGVGIYGSARYLAKRRTSDLEALEWVGWEAGSSMAFAQWMNDNVPRARVVLRVTHGWAIREAVDAGVGVAILPCALGGASASWRRVRRVEEAAAPLWILTHRDLRTAARVRVVRDAIADAVLRKRRVVEGR